MISEVRAQWDSRLVGDKVDLVTMKAMTLSVNAIICVCVACKL